MREESGTEESSGSDQPDESVTASESKASKKNIFINSYSRGPSTFYIFCKNIHFQHTTVETSDSEQSTIGDDGEITEAHSEQHQPPSKASTYHGEHVITLKSVQQYFMYSSCNIPLLRSNQYTCTILYYINIHLA